MLLILLKASIAALIFAIGMTATTEDIVYLWRRPALLLKSIIAMYVVMPAVAVLMARTFDLPPRTELALVVLVICAGAPLLPKKLIKFGGGLDPLSALDKEAPPSGVIAGGHLIRFKVPPFTLIQTT
jgi:BASS family bile acid:Na+ symporter